jgi:crossover junction endodeoxyribonuclease RuvC
MIIIGIDPGLATVGFGVIQKVEEKIIPVSYGCIRTSAEKQTSERLLEIYNEIKSLFVNKNVTSAMNVSEARGVILLAAQQKQIPLFEYTPAQIKQAITGTGRADKRQMQEMITRLLGLDEFPQPDDAADGLSIALCHIHIMR